METSHVDLDKQDRPFPLTQQDVDVLDEGVSVENTGEHVGAGALGNLRGGDPARRHVPHQSDIVRRLATSDAHRCEAEFVPEPATVLAEVLQRDGNILTPGDGFANGLDFGLKAIAALQEAAVSPDQFVAGIAGDVLERAVDVDERHTLFTQIADGQTIPG
nr:hypothetical protein [Mesorhizobium loti]